MAVPADSTRIVITGHLATSETFNTGFWLSGSAPLDDASASTMANLVANDFAASTLDTAMADLIYSDSAIDSITVYGYAGGGSVASAVGRKVLTAPVVGTGTTGNALQVSLVATLLTAQSSRHSRGRMYFPASGAAPVNHLMTAARVDALATGLADFLSKVRVEASMGDPSVISTVQAQHYPILQVRVDSRYDIQRRRANKQGGGYAKVAAVS